MDSEEKTILAAELALGLLDGEERRSALSLVAKDPDARAEYMLWQARFAALAEEIPAAEVAAPRRVRDRLTAVVGEEPSSGWWHDLLRMISDTSWLAMILIAKAGIILYLILLLL
jgi:anti-sigma-K factor RskA